MEPIQSDCQNCQSCNPVESMLKRDYNFLAKFEIQYERSNKEMSSLFYNTFLAAISDSQSPCFPIRCLVPTSSKGNERRPVWPRDHEFGRCLFFSPASLARGGGRGDSHMKGTGMLVVSLRVVNCRFWSRLGFLGRKANIFTHSVIA